MNLCCGFILLFISMWNILFVVFMFVIFILISVWFLGLRVVLWSFFVFILLSFLNWVIWRFFLLVFFIVLSRLWRFFNLILFFLCCKMYWGWLRFVWFWGISDLMLNFNLLRFLRLLLIVCILWNLVMINIGNVGLFLEFLLDLESFDDLLVLCFEVVLFVILRFVFCVMDLDFKNLFNLLCVVNYFLMVFKVMWKMGSWLFLRFIFLVCVCNDMFFCLSVNRVFFIEVRMW